MHLFLEGPIRTGKSTLLRECLAPYMEQLGGFSSQRLWQNGEPCGHRLVPASNPDLDAPYQENMSGIFIFHGSSGRRKDPTIFETLGIQLLSDTAGKPLILLDEIGGAELLVNPFRERLYEILAGPIPCIGVLKLARKAASMGASAGYRGDLGASNQRLRKDLKETFHSKVLYYEPQQRDALKEEITRFLLQTFKQP